jgi:hypothetical protein
MKYRAGCYVPAMAYRCLFLGAHNQVVGAADDIEAATPGEAVNQALLLLKTRPWYRGVELWDRTQRVYPAPASDGSTN